MSFYEIMHALIFMHFPSEKKQTKKQKYKQIKQSQVCNEFGWIAVTFKTQLDNTNLAPITIQCLI